MSSKPPPRPHPLRRPAGVGPWGQRDLPTEVPDIFTVGPVRIHLLAAGSEVRVASEWLRPDGKAALDEETLRATHASEGEYDADGVPLPAEPGLLSAPQAEGDGPDGRAAAVPPDLAWKRFGFRSAPGAVRVLPALPDRPLILSTGASLHLRPGAQMRIYVTVPVWISIQPLVPMELETGLPDVLQEFPTVTLSSTWFGDHLEGEMCYWTPSAARREVDVDELPPHLVACPVQIANSSEEPLPVDKLCLRVQHATVFQQGGHLWADETRIAYLGGGEFSRLHWSGRPPIEAMGAELLTPPRVPALKGLRAWTFAHLAELPGWRSH